MGPVVWRARADGEPAVDWGVAGWVIPGEQQTGDAHLVKLLHEGAVLAVIDALGHGPEAALIAKRVIGVLEDHAGQPPADLVESCHRALKGTRGAVMSVATLDARFGRLTWVGVGNVEAALLRRRADGDISRRSLASRGGVVGFKLPSLHPSATPLATGDLLVMATDGLQADFPRHVPLDYAPQDVADHLLARCGKQTDDALVLVVRYLGGPGRD